MKQIEENMSEGIVSLFDMSKFFDKESLLDCMYTLDKKANIDHKCYKIWYKLKENARLSVKTSFGDSKSKKVVSSLNMGCAIEDTFENTASTSIGNLNLNELCFQDDISKMNDNLEDARKR